MEALRNADDLIERLKKLGHGDYSQYRQEIADLWDKGHWDGNWDVTTDLNDPVLKDLRLIQEDEYDQHMDNGDEDGNPAPEWDDMLCDASSAYCWFA